MPFRRRALGVLRLSRLTRPTTRKRRVDAAVGPAGAARADAYTVHPLRRSTDSATARAWST